MVKFCQHLTDDVISAVRDISHNLSPSGLEIFGFSDVVSDLCDRIRRSTELDVAFAGNAGIQPGALSSEISIALYRVIQELFTNTIKHAHATKVVIEMEYAADLLRINYSDDGIGTMMAAPRKNGMGMHNIKSRLDMIDGHVLPGGSKTTGFHIQIQVPLNKITPKSHE